MDKNRKEIGALGEKMAERLLVGSKMNLIERNYRCKVGEIDLIMRDRGTLVFVEVKTKVGIEMGNPEEMVNKTKLAQVRRVAEVYIQNKQLAKMLTRIDVVAVVLSDRHEIQRINHYKAVY